MIKNILREHNQKRMLQSSFLTIGVVGAAFIVPPMSMAAFFALSGMQLYKTVYNKKNIEKNGHIVSWGLYNDFGKKIYQEAENFILKDNKNDFIKAFKEFIFFSDLANQSKEVRDSFTEVEREKNKFVKGSKLFHEQCSSFIGYRHDFLKENIHKNQEDARKILDNYIGNNESDFTRTLSSLIIDNKHFGKYIINIFQEIISIKPELVKSLLLNYDEGLKNSFKYQSMPNITDHPLISHIIQNHHQDIDFEFFKKLHMYQEFKNKVKESPIYIKFEEKKIIETLDVSGNEKPNKLKKL